MSLSQYDAGSIMARLRELMEMASIPDGSYKYLHVMQVFIRPDIACVRQAK
jgi:hypothetical protein